jgi:hypothetical protein
VVHEILGIRVPREVFGGRADSHHSLRHDGRMAEKGEETVYEARVAIVSDRLERAERVARGLYRRTRTGQRWVTPRLNRWASITEKCTNLTVVTSWGLV